MAARALLLVAVGGVVVVVAVSRDAAPVTRPEPAPGRGRTAMLSDGPGRPAAPGRAARAAPSAWPRGDETVERLAEAGPAGIPAMLEAIAGEPPPESPEPSESSSKLAVPSEAPPPPTPEPAGPPLTGPQWLELARYRYAIARVGRAARPARVDALEGWTAKYAIVSLGDIGAVDVLVEVVRERPGLATRAARTLGDLGPDAATPGALAALETMLEGNDERAAAGALARLGRAGQAVAERRLRRGYNAALVGHLPRFPEPARLVPLVLPALREGTEWRRRCLAWILADVGAAAESARPELRRWALSTKRGMLGPARRPAPSYRKGPTHWRKTVFGGGVALRVLLDLGVTDEEAPALAQAARERGEKLPDALEARLARIDPVAFDRLVAQLEPRHGVRPRTFPALKRLLAVGRPVPAARPLLEHPSQRVRRLAVRLAVETGDPAFERALDDPDASIRVEVARGLIRLGATRRAARLLAGCLADARVGDAAARALLGCGPDLVEARPELLIALRAWVRTPSVRWPKPVPGLLLACRALAPLPPPLCSALRAQLAEGGAAERVGRAMLLWRSGAHVEPLIPVLVEASRSYPRWRRPPSQRRPASVRALALRTLAEMGEAARPALPAAFVLRHDESIAVRSAARDLLDRFRAR